MFAFPVTSQSEQMVFIQLHSWVNFEGSTEKVMDEVRQLYL